MWNFRMLAVTGEAKYADVIERALYNGVNSGMSLNGTMYCYRNPLATNGTEEFRNAWYETTCCPPNLERILASLPGYMYATAADGVYVHLYDNSELNWKLEDGTPLRIEQQTHYPWEGRIALTVSPAKEREFTLWLRVPAWSANTSVTVNGQSVAGPRPGEYLTLRRHWRTGDRVELTLDMTPQLVTANPLVAEDTGKIAVQRGPLIYCLEQPDQKAPVGDLAYAAPAEVLSVARAKIDSADVLALEHVGLAYDQPLTDRPLYATLAADSARSRHAVTLRFVPYYVFANRGPAAMTVWVPLAAAQK